MGALPDQGKGELYGAEWNFRRTWIPEEMKEVTNALTDEEFVGMWQRAKVLQTRAAFLNPEANAIRQAILELFAWGREDA